MSQDHHNPDAALEGLNQAQRYAVTLGQGPILVIAGAGSGKTRTLVHRVAYLVAQGVEPQSILLLTFTRRASQEMLERARRMDPACAAVAGGTFHSLAYRLLRSHGSLLGLPPNFTVIDQADCQQIIKGAVNELGLKKEHDRRFPRARTLVSLISRSRNLEMSLADTIDYAAAHLVEEYGQAIEAAAEAFVQAKRAQGLVDYDDLLFMTESLLRANPDLRASLSRRWRYLLVDEYQDTNAVQARLLELLCSEHDNVMVVGDDAQSIYAFRGARVQNILEFPERFAGVRLVKLEQNYRSTQPILDLTNAIIASAAESYEKKLYTDNHQGARPELLRPRDERGQSRMVVERVQKLLDQGTALNDIAVLFRAGRDSFDLEVELAAARVPFVKIGGLQFLEAAHVKDVLSHLRVVANPTDYLSWQRVLMLLPRVGPKTAGKIIDHLLSTADDPSGYIAALAHAPQAGKIAELGELAELLDRLAQPDNTPVQMIETALEYYEPIVTRDYEDHPRRLRDLGELPSLARGYDNLMDFMAEVVLEPPVARAEETRGPRLTLSTIHSAKGLEWKHVLIIWLGEGRLPSALSLMDPEALEEERRLLYVAATRARQGLVLVAPREYYQRGEGLMPVRLSRFVEDLPPKVFKAEAAGPVFPAASPARTAPASRGTRTQGRPYAIGTVVQHDTFGQGKVMGYKGDKKVIVHFGRFGLKILMITHAKLEPVG